MTKPVSLISVSAQKMRLIPETDLSPDEFRALFHLSKKQWNLLVKDPPTSFKKGNPVTLSFLPVRVKPAATDKDVSFIYEDLFCVAAYKPPFLLVHSDGRSTDTLQDRVNARLIREGWPYPAQAIHRIDFEASGLVLFCKFPFFQGFFDTQMSEHQIKKEYLCVAEGRFPKESKTFTDRIGRDRHNAKKMIVSSRGKDAETRVRVIRRMKNQTLLKVNIRTGRKHQIRLHLSHAGYPLVNDPYYGIRKDDRGLLLQSIALTFLPPFETEPVCVRCPVDARFQIEK